MSQMFMDRRVAAGLVACGVLISSWIFIEASVFDPEVQPDAIADVDAQAMLLVRRAREQLSLHQAEETDRAIFMLRGALKHDPDLADARLTLSFALSTKATKFRGGAPEKIEAEELAHALITKDSSNSNAWSALGYALSAQGRSSEALAAYRQAFELDPENASALSSAAYLLLLRGELQQALILEVRAKHTGGASRYAEIQIAQVLELIDHPAADHWRAQAIALNPEQVVVLAVASKSYLRQGKPQAALELLEQYEGQEISAPQILVLKARALMALDRIEDAQHLFGMAGWRGHYGLAATHAMAGDETLAEALFPVEKRIELASDPDPDLRIQLAEVSAALGKENEALELISQAVSLGWRDIRWLQKSPFLDALMATKRGRQIEARVAQEVESQRRLIESTEELELILNG